MNEQTLSSGGNLIHRRFAGPGLRAGMAKDTLIFVIICSAALVVAAVTLLYSFRGGETVYPVKWQCLDCASEFSKKTAELSPIKCPKCGGQAVRLGFRACPECKKQVLVSRTRLTEQGQAQRDASAGQQDGGRLGIIMRPKEIQYWFKQADGSYGWTPWVPVASPAAMQFEMNLQCNKCGASLFFRASKSNR